MEVEVCVCVCTWEEEEEASSAVCIQDSRALAHAGRRRSANRRSAADEPLRRDASATAGNTGGERSRSRGGAAALSASESLFAFVLLCRYAAPSGIRTSCTHILSV